MVGDTFKFLIQLLCAAMGMLRRLTGLLVNNVDVEHVSFS